MSQDRMPDEQVSFLQQHPLGRAPLTADDVLTRFTRSRAWEERYRELIQLGKQLPAIPLEWRGDEQSLPGCESQVWLLAEQESNGVWHFAADSEARIVRGLLAVVLAALNHKDREAILGFDMECYFETLQLAKHLSPSRGNGLRAMVTAIRERVQTASALNG
jgi:cysteine desulfuration protein SufE